MENQHTLIKGYRDLPQADIDLMNEVKAHAEATQTLVEKIDQHIAKQFSDIALIGDDNAAGEELLRLGIAQPEKWVRLAGDDLQTGFMKLVRAVAQPTTF